MSNTNPTIKSKKFGNPLMGTLQNVRIVYRTGFYIGQDFKTPVFTVAVNNTIQGNYEVESDALVHWDRLVATFERSQS